MANNADARFSVYASDTLRELVNRHNSRSGRVNQIAARYQQTVRDELTRIRFTPDEWFAILESNSGVTWGDRNWQLAFANVDDSPEMDVKWNVDHTDIARRMRALSIAGRAAVAEVIDTFWAGDLDGSLTRTEQLEAAGVVLAGREDAA